MLRHSSQRGRLAHAYLFVGPEGTGKRTFAVQFAQCLLCEKFPESALESCGQCSGCKQVARQSHPDLFLIGCPEGKRQLPIELFVGSDERRGKEGLCYELSRTPMAGHRKIAVIDDAHLMNEASANALLKTLEEPPPGSVLILIATSTDTILPTIRSRCQVLRFGTLATEDVAALLLFSELTDDPALAAEAAALSEGTLLQAGQWLDPELRSLRDQLFDGLAAPDLRSVTLAEQMQEAAEAAGSEAPLQRARAEWIIRFCIEFFRGALLRLSAPESTEAVMIPQIERFQSRWNADCPEHLELLAECIERALLAETQIHQNSSVPLCLEALFDDLGRMLRGAVTR